MFDNVVVDYFVVGSPCTLW